MNKKMSELAPDLSFRPFFGPHFPFLPFHVSGSTRSVLSLVP